VNKSYITACSYGCLLLSEGKQPLWQMKNCYADFSSPLRDRVAQKWKKNVNKPYITACSHNSMRRRQRILLFIAGLNKFSPRSSGIGMPAERRIR